MNMNKEDWWQAMIVVIVILAAFNLAATLDLYGKAGSGNVTVIPNISIDNGIPVHYLIEEPICSQKLLAVLNESAIRFDPDNATSIDNEIQRQTEYWVGMYIERHAVDN
jgi:hypothetical protein